MLAPTFIIQTRSKRNKRKGDVVRHLVKGPRATARLLEAVLERKAVDPLKADLLPGRKIEGHVAII